MLTRNIYFTLACEENSKEVGLRPNTNKMVRFNTVVPLFKARKVFLPIEKKTEGPVAELLNELSLASMGGFKSKNDDGIDTVSMLSSLRPWKPSEEAPMVESSAEKGMWDLDVHEDTNDRMASYIV